MSAGARRRADPVGGLAAARRLVVKIGSALLVEEPDGAIRRAWLDALADDVADLLRRGTEVMLVSSGAIAVGRRHLGLPTGPLRLEEKQAAAATGQIMLAHAYQETLARHDVTVAQVLLTLDDTEQRRRHLNARSTLTTLLRLGTVPVINENDTVATSEIRFGDNDRLAARVAAMLSADTLVLLSDIDGLYTADPRRDPGARLVAEITEITPAIEAVAGEAPPGHPALGRALDRAQGLDRRQPEGGRRLSRRCRRAGRAQGRQEPAAGRHLRRRGRVRSRRRRARPRRRGPRGGARPVGLCQRRRPRHPRAQER